MEQTSLGSLPIHRVRFEAPATLSFSGYAEVFAMAVTSLSVHGVGCSGPEGLVLGDRLQLAFSLAPEEPPSDFPCEVIWVEPADEGTALYGMRFIGLTPEREQRLSHLLAERGGQCPPLGATAERQRPQSDEGDGQEGPIDLDAVASLSGEPAHADATGDFYDAHDLATYSLTEESYQRQRRSGAQRPTDLDAAIAEQTKRPITSQMQLTGAIPLENLESVGQRAQRRDELREALAGARRNVWTAALVGFALGAGVALAAVSFVAPQEAPQGQSVAP